MGFAFFCHAFISPRGRLLNTADIYVLVCLNKPISSQLLCHDQPIMSCDTTETAPKNFFRFFRGIFVPCPRKDETPRKVVRSEFFCFLWSSNLGKDQVRMFKKSTVDITRLIKRALDVDVSLYSSELFICTAIFYLRRLKRFEKITEMMQ